MEEELRGRWVIKARPKEGEIWTKLVAEDAFIGGEVEVDEVKLDRLSPSDRERLKRLVEVSASLLARRFVPLLDWWMEGERLFIVRGRLPGMCLWEWLESGRSPDPWLALSLARAASDAVAELYGKGCPYLGVSPLRVLVTEGMEVFLEGGAHGWLLEDLEPELYGLVEGYRAPEVERGMEGGRPADVYSLALLVRELLPEDSVSFRLSSFLDSCLDRLPSNRPTSPRLLMEMLSEEISGYSQGATDSPSIHEVEMSEPPAVGRRTDGPTTGSRKGLFPSTKNLCARIFARNGGNVLTLGEKGGKWRGLNGPFRVVLLIMVALFLAVTAVAFSRHDDKEKNVDPESVVAELSRVTLPDLVGLAQDEAVSLLEDMGLNVHLRESYSSLWSEGTVCASDPSAGAVLSPGDRVVLSVSKGWLPGTGEEEREAAGPTGPVTANDSSRQAETSGVEGPGQTAGSRSEARSDGVAPELSVQRPAPACSYNKPPVAKPSVSPRGGPAPLSVVLDASCSYDPDGRITLYLWECGDGTVLSGPVARHVYDAEVLPATFCVVLRVKDDRGAESKARVSITIL
ncbi:MAG: PASTA domain-containing protein [Candidatus Geothermincolales bacterium]